LREYVQGKQTYGQLAKQENVGKKTIQRRIDQAEALKRKEEIEPSECVILMDATYFKRSFGLMVWRDWYGRKNLLHEYVKYETVAAYKSGIAQLQALGWVVLGIVCDGRRGVLKGFPEIPTQMCHFHQRKIVQRYITQNPKLEASKELKDIVEWLPKTDRESFTELLRRWHEKWKTFLAETTVDPVSGKSRYTHRRLRSAYNSLKSNLPYLFTYLDYYGRNIPNTTNSLEGTFSNIDAKLGVHHGLKKQRKIKLIDSLLFG